MFKLWSSAHKQIILFGFHSGANKNTQYLEYFFCSFKMGKMMKGWTWNWKCFFNEVAFCITIKIRFEQLPVIKWEFNQLMQAFFLISLLWGPNIAFVDPQAWSRGGIFMLKAGLDSSKRKVITWEKCLGGFFPPHNCGHLCCRNVCKILVSLSHLTLPIFWWEGESRWREVLVDRHLGRMNSLWIRGWEF